MSSFLSNEEAKEYVKDFSTNTKRFMEEAIDSGICNFLRGCNVVLIVKKPELEDLGAGVIGLYLSFQRDAIWAYVAREGDYGIRDWLNLGEYNTSEHFEDVVSKAVKEAGTCNYCHNYVGYRDIRQVSFAGKSCIKCLPTARSIDEKPGWYN